MNFPGVTKGKKNKEKRLLDLKNLRVQELSIGYKF